jgi:hypothetical protein
MGVRLDRWFVDRLSTSKNIPACVKVRLKIHNKTRINVIHVYRVIQEEMLIF